MGAPKIIVPAGYQPDLDRLPPRPSRGCGGLLVALSLLFTVVFAGVWMLVSADSARPPVMSSSIQTPTNPATATNTPAPDATNTPTLDSWSLTGTALLHATASPTTDFCWWLTPTPTPSPTLIYTPDAWQSTGTAVYLATNPSVPPTPTPDAPRVWCNHITPTATITPLSLRRLALTDIGPTYTLTPDMIPPTPTFGAPSSSGGAWPAGASSGGSSGGAWPQPPQQPAADQPPLQIWQPTAPPPLIIPTARPTDTPTATASPTPSSTPTDAPTDTPTATASPTPSSTPTDTPTATASPTPSSTPAPSFVLLSMACDPVTGPSWIVQNTGGAALYVVWQISTDAGLVASGTWDYIPPGAAGIASAPAWAGIAGTYRLGILEPWLTYLPTPGAPPLLTCSAPPTPTDAAEVTQ